MDRKNLAHFPIRGKPASDSDCSNIMCNMKLDIAEVFFSILDGTLSGSEDDESFSFSRRVAISAAETLIGDIGS